MQDGSGGAGADEPLFDPAALERLQDLLPADRFAALVAQGMREIRDQVDALARQPPQPDPAAAFHRLVSVSGNLGLAALSSYCRAQERRSGSNGRVGAGEAAAYGALAQASLAALDDWFRRRG